MEEVVINRSSARWERLYTEWKKDKHQPGTLVIGGEQYKVIIKADDDVLFIQTAGGIDAAYGSMTGGITG